MINYRVTFTVSGGDITPVIVKVAHRKTIDKSFLQNEANIAALKEMHDKASYQLLSLAEVAVGFALGFALTLI